MERFVAGDERFLRAVEKSLAQIDRREVLTHEETGARIESVSPGTRRMPDEAGGQKGGTRELVLSPLPYIVVSAVDGDVVHVVRILHAAQQCPDLKMPGWT